METKIILGSHILKKIPEYLKEVNSSSAVCLIDQFILKKYGKLIDGYTIPIESGENSKILNTTLIDLINKIISSGINRNTTLICVGGGVVTDLGGFIGSILLRGIQTVYVSTTLLGMVDAALGGKTGINVQNGGKLYKNMVGTFYQPALVLCDTDFLSTLPEKELKSGIGEIVKYYIGWGTPKLSGIKSLLNSSKQDSTLIIRECQNIKMNMVHADPFEKTGDREKLNLGHTIGHGLEGEKNGAISHGEAVVWGLLGECYMSMLDGYLSKDDFEKIKRSILSLHLITSITFSDSEVLDIMKKDKKNNTYVAVKKIGDILPGVKINPVNLEKSLNYLKEKENI